jgi:hypothetical protein
MSAGTHFCSRRQHQNDIFYDNRKHLFISESSPEEDKHDPGALAKILSMNA